MQSGLTQDATNSLGPSSALGQGAGSCAPSSLKTASASCATHHAHDTQKTKEHSESCRSEWNRRRYVRSPRVARKTLESLIGGLSLYAELSAHAELPNSHISEDEAIPKAILKTA
jgi:hypothetical protein